MNPNPEAKGDERLREVLGQWTVETPLPPRFQEQVWRRIAQAEAKSPTTIALWAWLRHLLERSLARPKFAYSCAALMLILGGVGGSWAAHQEANRLDTTLGSRYVQSVDPYQLGAINQ